MRAKKRQQGSKLLEITMRDSLDALADAALYMAYHASSDTVEILSIEAPKKLKPKSSEVIQIQQYLYSSKILRSNNIVDYLLQRELKKTA